MPMMVCPRCGTDKPHSLDYYYVDRSHPSRLTTYCRVCVSEINTRSKAYSSQSSRYNTPKEGGLFMDGRAVVRPLDNNVCGRQEP